MPVGVAVAIASTEARSVVALMPPESSIEDRFRTAMKATFRHWMATDENDQFIAACEAVYATATEDEQERIKVELRSLADANALLSGVPVDFDAIAERIPTNPIGLRKLWQEVSV